MKSGRRRPHGTGFQLSEYTYGRAAPPKFIPVTIILFITIIVVASGNNYIFYNYYCCFSLKIITVVNCNYSFNQIQLLAGLMYKFAEFGIKVLRATCRWFN